MKEKQCTKCFLVKPLAEFVKDKRRSDGHGAHCVGCEREYRINYRENTREQEHTRRQKRRKNFPEETRSRDRVWRVTHRERLKDYFANYRDKNRDKCRAYANKWVQVHQEKARDCRKKAIAKRRGAYAEKIVAREIFERDRWICQLCKTKVNRRLRNPHPLCPSLDHIIPLARGGSHTKENVQLAHLVCNMRAQTRGIKQLRLIG